MNKAKSKRVRVLINQKSGVMQSFGTMQKAFDKFWDIPGVDLSYQFSQSAEDGRRKAEEAVRQGIDILLIVGGDGTVSTTGAALIGTDVALGVIPTGSGNGFARHFDIPLSPPKAVHALANAEIAKIDIGVVNDHPFLVTCSMAWDAAIVRSFEKSPVRGILPYVFAGVYEFFDYESQEMRVKMDSGESLVFSDPLVFTIANLTQFGGGAVIVPDAEPDDGLLELIVARRQDMPVFLANMHKLLSRSVSEMPKIIVKKFKSLIVKRLHPAQIQMDGELIEADSEIRVKVLHKALNVLVPLSHRS